MVDEATGQAFRVGRSTRGPGLVGRVLAGVVLADRHGGDDDGSRDTAGGRAAPAGARFGVPLCLGEMNHAALGRGEDLAPVVALANALGDVWPAGRPLEYVARAERLVGGPVDAATACDWAVATETAPATACAKPPPSASP